MHLEFDTSVDDVVDFNEHFAFVEMKRTSRERTLISASIASLAILLFVYHETKHLISSLVVGAILMVVQLLLLPKVQRDRVRKAVHKMYAAANANDDCIGHQSIDFTNSGIHSITRNSDSRLEWSSVNKIIFTPKHCFLFIGPNKAFILPKKAMQDCANVESNLRCFIAEDKIQGTWLSGA